MNTANVQPTVGTGCDYAVYLAAVYDELLTYREEKLLSCYQKSLAIAEDKGIKSISFSLISTGASDIPMKRVCVNQGDLRKLFADYIVK